MIAKKFNEILTEEGRRGSKETREANLGVLQRHACSSMAMDAPFTIQEMRRALAKSIIKSSSVIIPIIKPGKDPKDPGVHMLGK